MAARVEALRQELLRANDIHRVTESVRAMGIRIDQGVVRKIKEYNFNSRGLNFATENYLAWRRLATGKATVSDVRYIVHEQAELQALERTGFKFMGDPAKKMTREELRNWSANFDWHYGNAHSAAYMTEYEFIAKVVSRVTNDRVSIRPEVAAAIDPVNRQPLDYMFIGIIPLRESGNLAEWEELGRMTIQLTDSMVERLGAYRGQVTIGELIELVRRIPVDRWSQWN